jgi:hypothetical protein
LAKFARDRLPQDTLSHCESPLFAKISRCEIQKHNRAAATPRSHFTNNRERVMSSTTTEKRLSRRDALRGAGAGAVAATVMTATDA